MKLILEEDVQNLGFKDDVVSVKSGYGRNFLIPKGKAIIATTSALKILQENLKQRTFKEKSIVSHNVNWENSKGLYELYDYYLGLFEKI